MIEASLGWSDSDSAKNPENWNSISRMRVFLEECPVRLKSGGEIAFVARDE